MVKVTEIMMLASKIVMWTLGPLLIYWLILKITGHSPTASSVLISLNAIIIGAFVAFSVAMFHMAGNIGGMKQQLRDLERRFDRYQEKTDGRFSRMDRRFSQIDKRLYNLESDMSIIKHSLTGLAEDFRRFAKRH